MKHENGKDQNLWVDEGRGCGFLSGSRGGYSGICHRIPFAGVLESDPQEAGDLMARVSLPHKSCIVTGGSPGKILDLARELKPDLIQLHYRETLEDTKQILQALEPLGVGVIKTVPPDRLERIRQFGTEDLSAIASLLEKAGVYAILADSRTPENAARRSKNLDKVLFCGLMEVSRKPVILAGGITPENIGEILEDCGASFIDVMSGVENSPGVKDREKILQLIRRARRGRDSEI
jgi:phosphoribosylanthranilate isomerase